MQEPPPLPQQLDDDDIEMLYLRGELVRLEKSGTKIVRNLFLACVVSGLLWFGLYKLWHG
jgi:hypothetical protein